MAIQQSLQEAHMMRAIQNMLLMPTILWFWTRQPYGYLVLQPALTAPLPLWTRNTGGVNPVSQESENVAQNKVGVQLGHDTHTDPGRGPTSFCSRMLYTSALLQQMCLFSGIQVSSKVTALTFNTRHLQIQFNLHFGKT